MDPLSLEIPYRLSALERLPIELLREIMSFLSDTKSLREAALSCVSLFEAFAGAENAITTRVVCHQIDAAVFSEAVAALESSALQPHVAELRAREKILEFAAQHLRQRVFSHRSWTLGSALRLGRLHHYVSDFTQKSASAALAKRPRCQPDFVAPTENEIRRIERAFYRFEIYCNLFRESENVASIVLEQQKTLFFTNFCPWENEQLGCVHDFLYWAASPAFNDIAAHDIDWGRLNVQYADDFSSPYIQYLLSLGLEKLHPILGVEAYEARHKLLYCGKSPSRTWPFLYKGLEDANERNSNLVLNELSTEEERNRIKSPFYSESDTGPADIWRWAHQGETLSHVVYQANRETLREWGYVMWDRSRLDSFGIFDEPWDAEIARRNESWEHDQAIERHIKMRASWEKREQVYIFGGTGWWNPGDYSKIQWPGGKVPVQFRKLPALPVRHHPTSLDGAREMLSMMKLPFSSSHPANLTSE